ncbi:LOW QUALITY PROTEIN: hypothetical protein PHMEG_00027535 [Phytophthora megakarya]|uniref:Uncharacterized protein n=1 Tax=Phytophthora megakarya TaxID=4795 RepID=A0A225V765_9STRA|nr:LOW QUALITY PROTEIN: hypothetical protein PHMEG_00027535 [Phytophthora megakarya]
MRSRAKLENGSPSVALRRRKATLFEALKDRRPLSLNEEIGEVYMRHLRALFMPDNAVIPNKLLVLLNLMGVTAAEFEFEFVVVSAATSEARGIAAEVRTFGVTASGKLTKLSTFFSKCVEHLSSDALKSGGHFRRLTSSLVASH